MPRRERGRSWIMAGAAQGLLRKDSPENVHGEALRAAERNAHGDGTGLDLDFEALNLCSIPSVELI